MQNFTNVLVAEDNEDDFLFLADALHYISPAVSVRRAKDGLECLHLLKTASIPDLIFLDLDMPYIKGLECLKYIKAHEKFSSIPVVMYSSSFYIKFIDTAFKEGAHYFLVKPSKFSGIKNLLENLFERLLLEKLPASKQSFVLKENNILREQYV